MNLGRFTKILGGVVVGLITLGVIANFPDIKRYARMTMM
jgi:Family of unknown function (DUF6893)